MDPLPEDTKARLYHEFGIKNNYDFVKHILTKHDGEARIVIDNGFAPVRRGVDIRHHAFWHYQYASTYPVRQWLYERFQNENKDPLTDDEIHWIMKAEGFQTMILRWDPSARTAPASGGRRPAVDECDFKIRQGNFVTLAELFDFGQTILSCYHLYMMYIHMGIYIYKKAHSESRTEHAIFRGNAKRLRCAETGSYRLP